MNKGGMPGNIKALMQQAQQMQVKLQKAKEEAKEKTVESSAGGGAVKIVANCNHEVLSCEISPEAAQDVEVLSEMIVVAVNDAMKKANSTLNEAISKITGGVDVPGFL